MRLVEVDHPRGARTRVESRWGRVYSYQIVIGGEGELGGARILQPYHAAMSSRTIVQEPSEETLKLLMSGAGQARVCGVRNAPTPRTPQLPLATGNYADGMMK